MCKKCCEMRSAGVCQGCNLTDICKLSISTLRCLKAIDKI